MPEEIPPEPIPFENLEFDDVSVGKKFHKVSKIGNKDFEIPEPKPTEPITLENL